MLMLCLLLFFLVLTPCCLCCYFFAVIDTAVMLIFPQALLLEKFKIFYAASACILAYLNINYDATVPSASVLDN